jgi:hypothetical protein
MNSDFQIDLQTLQILLEARGITLEPKPDGKLKINAQTTLEPELLEAIKTHKSELLERLPKPHQPTAAQLPLPLPESSGFRPKPLPLHLEKFARAARAGSLPPHLADLVVQHVGWWFVFANESELEALERLHKAHYGTIQA